jgi:hypothetical protein
MTCEDDRNGMRLRGVHDGRPDIDRVGMDDIRSQRAQPFLGPRPHRAHSTEAAKTDAIQPIRCLDRSDRMDAIRGSNALGPVHEDVDIVAPLALSSCEGGHRRCIPSHRRREFLGHMEDSHDRVDSRVRHKGARPFGLFFRFVPPR